MSKKSVVDAFLLDDDVESPVDVPSYDAGKSVPNQLPIITGLPYKLAIIGEAPGADETREGRPFVGMSGRFLTSLMSKAGIVRDACLIANVCQHRPPGNDITKFSRDGTQFTEGLAQLGKDLNEANPNVCLLLGKTALWAAKGTDNIFDWRGSWFIGTKPPFVGRKCIASFHPAYCLRQYDGTPLLMFDIKKALTEATHPEWIPPQRTFDINLSVQDIVDKLETIYKTKPLIAFDIEGGVSSISCLSIATSPSYAFIIPFTKFDGTSFYDSIDDELSIWTALAKVLGDPLTPKILQNSLYDRFVLQYSYSCAVRGVVGDTMLESWELYCELEKSLGFLCSLYTSEPFYKQDRKTHDRDTFWRYCCRDSAVTWEIFDKLKKWVVGPSRAHGDFNLSVLNPILYAEIKGIRYDGVKAKQRREEVLQEIYRVQYLLDQQAKCGLDFSKPKNVLLDQIRDIMAYKRDRTRPTEKFVDCFDLACRILLGPAELSHNERGFLNTACKLHMNTKGKDFKPFLFTTRGLPPQYKTEKKGGVVVKRLTTDFEALLKLKKHSTDVVIDHAISLTMHRTRAQMLCIVPDRKGRMRCSYNLVGSETGRITSSRSVDWVGNKRVGTNMQTVSDDWEIENEELVLLTEGLRSLYQADEGYNMFQCDLKGSDGWTIGAHMAALGDPTMLDDLRFGLKPAQIVCYILRHGYQDIATSTRAEIKELLKEVKKEDWDYYVCKQIIWGTCYLMGPRKAAEQAFKESYGKVNLGEKEAKEFQGAVFSRYRVRLWHDSCTRNIGRQSYPPKQVSASGQTRKFFGRSREILGEWLANEPQQNTTYATNLAALKLWNDTENRQGDGRHSSETNNRKTKLRVEPLHQVHDALLVQAKISDTDWCISKLKQWFTNTLMIAGIPIVIPFDGNYGPSWGELDKPIL